MPTYGASGQPAQSVFNYDAVMSTSLGNYRKTLTDNISSNNLLFKQLKSKGFWEPAEGAAFLGEDLLYGLGSMDSYDGYDELPLTPTEGVTQAQFDWAQLAAPFAISGKERKMNKTRIISLIATKLNQLDITMQEGFTKHFIQGQLADGGTGSLALPKVSVVNGSKSLNPLGMLVSYTPTANVEVGGINQSTQPWWRNNVKVSAAVKYQDWLMELDHMRNDASKGPGGVPDVIWMDQISTELLCVAYYQHFQTPIKETGDYPFPVLNFRGSLVSWDQYLPDVHTGDLGTTWGTAYMLNTKFLRVRPESETDFVQTDMQQPINQDAKYKHVLWMGNATVNNRKKQSVMGHIARTMTT
jgi:hypothetical protein